MATELRRRVFEFLSARPDKKFKARDIAEWFCSTYPDEARDKLDASDSLNSEVQLLNQLVAEIGANRPRWEAKHKQFRSTDGVRPRLFYWTEKTEKAEVEQAEEVVAVETNYHKLTEHDLYPKIVEFMKDDQGVNASRIDEKKSSNKNGLGGNKWLFPDVVGMEDLTKGLQSEVVSAMREGKGRRLRLWSFEAKLLINRSNAREAYFQAVSNCSWANLGYLVAAEISGTNTLNELRILYAMHGIGLIKLDVDAPSESEIIIPAREKSDIEWAMCSRLAEENSDFRDFMTRVRQFYQTGDLPK